MANAAVSNAIYSSPQFTKKLSSSASTLQSEISANCSVMNIAHLGKRIDRKLDLGKMLDFVYILFICRKKIPNLNYMMKVGNIRHYIGHSVVGDGYIECQTFQVDHQQQQHRNHKKKLSEASRSYSTGKLSELEMLNPIFLVFA